MADLFSILSMGSAALSVHRAASATASHNLENANTPGYSRQRANLSATLPAFRLGGSFIGQGVSLNTVSQARDFGAERQFSTAQSTAARSQAQADSLQTLTALDPQAAGGVGSSLADFYGAMRTLAQNPGDLSLRQTALGQVKTVALAFNRAADGIDSSRDAIDSKLSGQFSDINSLTQQMAELNKQVSIARASGAEPNDLLDARQQVQDKLIGLTGAVPIPDNKGNVNLSLTNGVSLVSVDQYSTVSGVPDAANSGHLALQLTRNGVTTALSGAGGTIGGELDARDVTLKNAQSSLDTLAFDVANAVNTAHSAGYGLDGVNGRNLFDVSATSTGAAAALTLSTQMNDDPSRIGASASAATVPGDGTALQGLVATEQQALTGGLDALSRWSSMLSNYGADSARATSAASADAAVLENVSGLRDSASGVSIDEELIELQKSQRAFEAVSKVIQTTNDMLDTLMSIKQ